jgi:hypothetical protein
MNEQTLDKQDMPESFGVFKPVNHVVMAFARREDRDAAREALLKDGFGPEELTNFTAQEMLAQTTHQIETASGTSAFGYEIVLAKEHRILAEEGQEWLAVHAPKTEQSDHVAEVAKQHNASIADRYGRLVVEHLLQPPPNS